jgi:preprotein translocase subunit SecG
MPFAMGFAVVATANHFVLDVLVAAVVVSIGLSVAMLLERHRAAEAGARSLGNRGGPALGPRLH